MQVFTQPARVQRERGPLIASTSRAVKQRLPFRLVLALCAALLGAACFTGQAHAEDALGYEAAIGAAVQEYERGNWLEAIELFRRAHALAPSARTHRGLGLSYFEARRYALAVQHLEAALADQRRPLTAQQRKEVGDALARARALVGEVVLTVVPGDALVLVDGRALERGEHTLALDAGSHELAVSRQGYATQQRTVDVAGEQHLDLRIELEAERAQEPQRSAVHAPAAQDSERDSAHASVLAPIIVVSAGGAALAAALVTGMMESSAEHELEDAGCEQRCDPKYDPTLSKAKTLQVSTNVLLVAGSALVAGGGLWWLLAASHSDPSDHPPSALQASGLCLRAGCSAALRGTF